MSFFLVNYGSVNLDLAPVRHNYEIMKPGTPVRPNSIRRSSWIYISGIAFLLALGASAVLIIYGKRLEDLGITGNIYYIILIPLGFSCAAFLAGAMKSYASFKSNENFTYGQL